MEMTVLISPRRERRATCLTYLFVCYVNCFVLNLYETVISFDINLAVKKSSRKELERWLSQGSWLMVVCTSTPELVKWGRQMTNE